MMLNVDARGDACPLPVVKAKKAIAALNGAGEVEVLVDNEIAVQNLTKMAQQKGYGSSAEKLAEREYRVRFTVGDASAVRDYVEAAERVRLAANVEKAMAALLDGVPDGERDKMIEDRDKIGMMKDAEALPALEALRKGEWKA